MHNFSIESSERKIVPFVLAAIAIGLTALAQTFAAKMNWQLPAWISTPSSFAIYGVLYAGFEHHFWRFQFLRSIGLVKVPILRGEWTATMSSSLDNFAKEFSGPISISQTWTKIHIYFGGTDAFSHSHTASLTFVGPSRISFIYVYQSEKRPEFADNEYMHFGTARLIGKITAAGIAAKLDGSYFTDKSRHTYGRIKLQSKV